MICSRFLQTLIFNSKLMALTPIQLEIRLEGVIRDHFRFVTKPPFTLLSELPKDESGSYIVNDPRPSKVLDLAACINAAENLFRDVHLEFEIVPASGEPAPFGLRADKIHLYNRDGVNGGVCPVVVTPNVPGVVEVILLMAHSILTENNFVRVGFFSEKTKNAILIIAEGILDPIFDWEDPNKSTHPTKVIPELADFLKLISTYPHREISIGFLESLRKEHSRIKDVCGGEVT